MPANDDDLHMPDFPPQDEHGVDLSLIEYNLSLTPAQRLAQNEEAVKFIEIVREAGRKFYGSKHHVSSLETLRRLSEANVEFIIIGDVAAIAHGGQVMTCALSLCAPLHHDNAALIIRALAHLNPRWFTRSDLPVIADDSPHLRGLKNMYLRTDVGRLDVLGELPGVGTYDDIASRHVTMDFDGHRCRVLDVDTLIAAKTFAGRDRGKEAVRHLEAVLKMRRDNPGFFDHPS